MKGFFFALSVACGIVRAAADPLADFEITPGPGMPSLESVGLSKEKLHKMSLEEIANPGTHVKARAISRIERSPLLARDDITRTCLDDHPAELSCALWCILYLNDLGDTQCVADEGPPYWCVCHRNGSKGATIYGVSGSPISYPCRYVADLLSWVPTTPIAITRAHVKILRNIVTGVEMVLNVWVGLFARAKKGG